MAKRNNIISISWIDTTCCLSKASYDCSNRWKYNGRTTQGEWDSVCVCGRESERREKEREREKTDKQRVEEKLCILILNRHELELPFLTIPRPLKCQSFPLYIYIYIYIRCFSIRDSFLYPYSLTSFWLLPMTVTSVFTFLRIYHSCLCHIKAEARKNVKRFI